jgi:hypothetical protein
VCVYCIKHSILLYFNTNENLYTGLLFYNHKIRHRKLSVTLSGFCHVFLYKYLYIVYLYIECFLVIIHHDDGNRNDRNMLVNNNNNNNNNNVTEHIDKSTFVGLLCTFTAKHLQLTTALFYYRCST